MISLIEALRTKIASNMCTDAGELVDGAAHLQVAVRPKGDPETLTDEEKSYIAGLIKTLGMKESYPYIARAFRTTEADIAYLGDDCPVCLHSTLCMMQAWTDYCAGTACSHQIALDDSMLETIRNEYRTDNNCAPEESGLSPRGGAMVVELVCADADWVAVQLDVVCLSALGMRRDAEIAKECVDYFVDALSKLTDGDLAAYKLKECGRFPEM